MGLESVASDGGVNLSKPRRPAAQSATTLSYLFSNLPLELQIQVFELAIAGYNSNLLTLTRVCRRWRKIIIARPLFWRHLVLTGKTTQEGVDTWLHRAGGILSSIRINFHFSFLSLPNVFRKATPEMWSSLDSFEIVQRVATLQFDTMLGEILSQLKVESLKWVVYVSSISSSLCDMEGSRLRCLSLRAVDQMTLGCLSFPSLTNLELSGEVQTDDLLAFMAHHSQIETLVLECCRYDSTNVDIPEQPVTLANLRSFTLSRKEETDALCRSILFPNLEVLSLALVVEGDGWLEAITSQRLVRLETVSLYRVTASPSTLIDFLRQAGAVTQLTLDFKLFNGTRDDQRAVIAALSERIPPGDARGLSGSLSCPRLQHLSFSCMRDLYSLVELVKARLPRETLPPGIDPCPAVSNCQSQGGPLPLPIISLHLDRCVGGYHEDDLRAWLRANVPKYTTIDYHH